MSEDPMDIIREVAGRTPFQGKPRDPERIERMLDLIREIWETQPDTRLLQLLINAAPQGAEPVPHLYHLEDGLLERRLREHRDLVEAARTGKPGA